MPLIHPSRPGRLNPKKPWVPRFATDIRPPSAEAVIYADVRRQAPAPIALGYGVDHRGSWARVGDCRARAKTAAAALQAALAKHLGPA